DFSADGRYLLTASIDGARVWDTDAGKVVAFVAEKYARCARFIPGGCLLTCGGSGLKKWPREQGAEIGGRWRFAAPVVFGNKEVPLDSLSTSRDGRVVSADYGAKVFVFDTDTRDLKFQSYGDTQIYRSALSP